jgi:hypothetical protein
VLLELAWAGQAQAPQYDTIMTHAASLFYYVVLLELAPVGQAQAAQHDTTMAHTAP